MSFASVPDVASFDESWCKEQRAERAFANAIIAGGLKRNPEGVYERIAHVARSFTENGRYSAEEGSAAVDQLLNELEAHGQPRHSSLHQERRP